MKRLMIQRIIEIKNDGSLGFDSIEQFRGIVEVEDPDAHTARELIELAYTQNGEKPKWGDKHRITALGKSMEVE